MRTLLCINPGLTTGVNAEIALHHIALERTDVLDNLEAILAVSGLSKALSTLFIHDSCVISSITSDVSVGVVSRGDNRLVVANVNLQPSTQLSNAGNISDDLGSEAYFHMFGNHSEKLKTVSVFEMTGKLRRNFAISRMQLSISQKDYLV